MTGWFADTFFFLAFLDERDDAHGEALALARRMPADLVTTVWVLTEVGDGLADSAYRDRFGGFVRFLRSSPHVVVLPFDQRVFDLALELYEARPDKQWSLTDCTSFVVMREHDLTEALTADHHFEQAGFTILMK